MTLQVLSTALAAVAAVFAAVSSWTSLLSARATEDEARLARAQSRHDLFRSFEADLTKQYEGLWECLGPWDDGLPEQVRPSDRERRVVHDLLQTLSSVYLAGRLGLLHDAQRRYAEALFLDWLSTVRGREVWELVSRKQATTWPPGFPEWVDRELANLDTRSPPQA